MSVPVSSQEAYVKRGECLDLLQQRASLKKEVEDFWAEKGWRSPLPSIANMAVLARSIGTFRFEDGAFVLLAERERLMPCWFEYRGDKMSSASKGKMSLLNLITVEGIGKNGGVKVKESRKLINDFDRWDGKPLDTIPISSGGTLVDFHNMLQDRMYPRAIRFDATKYYREIGSVKDYYIGLLSLFIAHAVLFEDYHGGESGTALNAFSFEVFEPAWQAVTKRFGVPPLITKMPWDPNFRFYPADSNWRQSGVIKEEHLV